MKRLSLLGLVVLLAACQPPLDSEQPADTGAGNTAEGQQKFSSDQATLLNFDFEGSFDFPGNLSAASARGSIDAQMLYTMGHLNEHNSVGRLDKIEITNVATESIPTGTRVTFHVKLPVAWGIKSQVPATYEFTLPRVMGFAGLEAFATKYATTCIDRGAHDVTSGDLWYYYRPLARGCALAAEDVIKTTAQVSVSAENTTGKYPEYNKVWEDKALNVVAIFGKYEDGATTSSDAGISAYNAFIRAVTNELSRYSVTTSPATVPANPGVGTPDISFTATLPDGRTLVVTALLVDNVRTAGAGFDSRYTALSTTADVIMYNGHAGLGQNVRALARKGSWVAGQYLMLFMNGCDTFAYVDGSLAQARASINTDDPTGTRYLDIITNAMPAYFHSMAGASIALIRGLSNTESPSTYDQIFQNVDDVQVVAVTGEEDNTFVPGDTGTPPGPWSGLDESGTVARGEEKRFETPTLAAGKYLVTLSGTADADLYVKSGTAPTSTSYDCRPYKNGSEESCTLTLSTPGTLHLLVQGYAASSDFHLVAKAE